MSVRECVRFFFFPVAIAQVAKRRVTLDLKHAIALTKLEQTLELKHATTITKLERMLELKHAIALTNLEQISHNKS